MELDARRLSALRAALAFLRLPPRAPELRLLHRWLDTGSIGLVRGGLACQRSPRATRVAHMQPVAA